MRKSHTEETKRKISQSLKGNIPWNKGVSTSTEHLKSFWFKKGEKPNNYKGIIVHNLGYKMIHIPNHPNAGYKGYVYEHRLVMEKVLGRYLLPTEIVDHINAIKNDNRIENLRLFMTQSAHMKEEWKRGRFKKNKNIIYK